MRIEFKMAWRSIWRHPRRSVLTLAAICFATLLLIFMLSWQFGSYATMINSAVRIHTGHLQVQARGYLEKRDMRLTVDDPDAVRRRLEAIPGSKAWAFRASAFCMVSSASRTRGAMVVGIDPQKEAQVSSLRHLVRAGRFLRPGDTLQALAGRLLAKALKVGPGDELVLLGQGRDGSIAATTLTVVGVFESGQDEFDRGVIHIPLATFQEVFSMEGTVHQVVIQAESLDRVSRVKAALASSLAGVSERLVVLDWEQLMPGLIQAIRMDLISGFIFYIILIVVVAFSILNTFLMALFERTREFGILLAVGMTPSRLSRLLLLESGTMTALGIGAGIGAGILTTLYFEQHGIRFSDASEILRHYGLPERMYPRLSILSVGIGSAVVLVITFLTALYPAFKVRRLKPVEAVAAA